MTCGNISFAFEADCWENTAFQAARHRSGNSATDLVSSTFLRHWRQHLPRNAVEVTIFQREMAEIANFDQRGAVLSSQGLRER